MTEPIETVAAVAKTPAQAKVFVAMLTAEGIPARTDGDLLADEFAASRRMLNLLGCKVFVPTRSLDRARDILQPVSIDAADLEQQALAESDASVANSTGTVGTDHTKTFRLVIGLLLLLLIGSYLLMRS
jgi:hypothetical protein